MALPKDDEKMQGSPAPTPQTAPTTQPDPWSVLERLTSALEKMHAAPKTDRTDVLMETLSTALARVAETQLQAGQMVADETRRAARPSNQVVPGISVFNRRGLNLPDNAEGMRKPPLKCIMLIPWLAEWESLTSEEVQLLNLLQSGDYIIARIDKSKVKISVHIDYGVDDVTPSRLIMTHDTAFNNDYFKLMPDLAGWIRQMLKQHDKATMKAANEVLTDEEEAALIDAGDLTISA